MGFVRLFFFFFLFFSMYTTCLKINKHQKQPGRNEGGQAGKQLSQSPVCFCSREAVSRPRVCAMLQATARKFKAVGSKEELRFSLHCISVPELFTSALLNKPKTLAPLPPSQLVFFSLPLHLPLFPACCRATGIRDTRHEGADLFCCSHRFQS